MSASEPTPALERWKALALLLPPYLLAWPGPGSISRDDLLPHATGAGAVALAVLPAALLFALRPGPTRPRAFLVLPLLFLAGACGVGSATDDFEVRRAALLFATSMVLFFGGAGLAKEGLRVLSRGLVALSLVLVVCAFLDWGSDFVGTLGNTGSTAMAAVPGALVGAVLLARGSRGERLVGGLTVALYLAYTLRAPVVAGSLALAAGVAALLLATRGRARVVPASIVLVAGLSAWAPLARQTEARADAGSSAAAPSTAAASPAGPSGGFEVRWRVWSASLGMLRDRPWLGVGPGQFAASFPPYRDPREIEISTHGRALEVETEVEHPHQDWLLPALELGAPLGLLWIAFLVLVGSGAWRAVRGDDPDRTALGAASIGVLAYALVHAPLTHIPAAATVAFTAFGAVLARPGRLRTWPLLLLLLCAAPAARAHLRHGLWLASLARPAAQDAKVAEHAIESALNCCHDSAVGTALLAQLHEEKKGDLETAARHWSGVLRLRPHRVEARMQLGLALARQGDFAGAREQYERARALDPDHPGIAHNLLLLDLEEGRLEKGSAWLGGDDPSPERCYDLAKHWRTEGDPLRAELFEARAHILWARSHAAGGRFGDAVRSYRQCVRVTGGAARVRLELAAALQQAGREDEARAELAGIATAPIDRAGLPAWTVGALRSLEPAQ